MSTKMTMKHWAHVSNTMRVVLNKVMADAYTASGGTWVGNLTDDEADALHVLRDLGMAWYDERVEAWFLTEAGESAHARL